MDRRTFTAALFAVGSQLFSRPKALAASLLDGPTGRPNAVTPTLGGKQFWADVFFFHRWHIQRSVFSGHFRLLDERNCRHAWGTFEQCQTKLDAIRTKRELPPMSGRAVIVLHGLFRTSSSMQRMCRYLEEQGGYTAFNVSYPSTRASIGTHAENLARIVRRLDGIEEIHFVAHSLGNLVIRHYLGDHTDDADGKCPDPRIKRIVMLGPPNNGARIAEVLGRNNIFDIVVGQSGTQLARTWNDLSTKLCTPRCEFGIIAGGRNDGRGFNPLLGEDNDLIVSVETTKLPGAEDFKVMPVLHTYLMDNPEVQACTLRFLEHGYFTSPDERQPLDITI